MGNWKKLDAHTKWACERNVFLCGIFDIIEITEMALFCVSFSATFFANFYNTNDYLL